MSQTKQAQVLSVLRHFFEEHEKDLPIDVEDGLRLLKELEQSVENITASMNDELRNKIQRERKARKIYPEQPYIEDDDIEYEKKFNIDSWK